MLVSTSADVRTSILNAEVTCIAYVMTNPAMAGDNGRAVCTLQMDNIAAENTPTPPIVCNLKPSHLLIDVNIYTDFKLKSTFAFIIKSNRAFWS